LSVARLHGRSRRARSSRRQPVTRSDYGAHCPDIIIAMAKGCDQFLDAVMLTLDRVGLLG
jgi:hypothetical protein